MSPRARARTRYAAFVALRTVLALQLLPTGPIADLLAGAIAMVVGLCLSLVAFTLVGLALWAAFRMRPSGLATWAGRWALGGVGSVLLWVGLVVFGSGVAGAADHPFGPGYDGTFSLIAWLVAFHVGLLDAALSATLAQRLADRTDDALHRLALVWSVTATIGAWGLRVFAKILVAIVALGLFLEWVA